MADERAKFSPSQWKVSDRAVTTVRTCISCRKPAPDEDHVASVFSRDGADRIELRTCGECYRGRLYHVAVYGGVVEEVVPLDEAVVALVREFRLAK